MRKFSVSRRLAAVAGEEARQRVVRFEGLRSEANRQASHNLKRAAKIKEFIGE